MYPRHRASLYLAGQAAKKMELTRCCLLCWRCCLLAFLYFTNTMHSVHGLSLHIPQSQLHQLLPLGTNATVQCIPEPPESRPNISWSVDTIPYENHVNFYTSRGIFVYWTADNISSMVVEGRLGQQNRTVTCRTITSNGFPVASNNMAVIKFYGPPTSPTALTVKVSSLLSLLLLWNASHGENITYQLTATQADDNGNQKQFIDVMSTLYIFNGEHCKEYMFVVRAINLAGSSNNSNAVTATIPGPPAVGQLDIAVSNFSLTVSLPTADCGNYSTSYSIILSRNYNMTIIPVNMTSSLSLSLSTLSVRLTHLMTNIVYNLTLKAVNVFGTSYSTPMIVCILSAPIENVIGVLNNTVHLSWYPPSHDPLCVDHYLVNVTSEHNTVVFTTNDTFITLKSGSYVISVAGVDASNNTGDYYRVSFTVTPLPTLSTTAALSASPSAIPPGSNAAIIGVISGVVAVVLVLHIGILLLVMLVILAMRIQQKGAIGDLTTEVIRTEQNAAYDIPVILKQSTMTGGEGLSDTEMSTNVAYATLLSMQQT